MLKPKSAKVFSRIFAFRRTSFSCSSKLTVSPGISRSKRGQLVVRRVSAHVGSSISSRTFSRFLGFGRLMPTRAPNVLPAIRLRLVCSSSSSSSSSSALRPSSALIGGPAGPAHADRAPSSPSPTSKSSRSDRRPIELLGVGRADLQHAAAQAAGRFAHGPGQQPHQRVVGRTAAGRRGSC